MAEINRITVFKDETGTPSYALVDGEHRVLVTLDQVQVGTYASGDSGAITANTETTVVSYTVPSGKVFKLTGWRANGKAHAVFSLFLNGDKVVEERNSVASPNVGDNLGVGLKAEAAEVITIKVLHHEMGKTVNFHGTILGTLEDA